MNSKISWLSRLDERGVLAKSWAKASLKGPLFTYCIPCPTDFKTEKGFEKINQHAKGPGHRIKSGNLEPRKHGQSTLNQEPSARANVDATLN